MRTFVLCLSSAQQIRSDLTMCLPGFTPTTGAGWHLPPSGRKIVGFHSKQSFALFFPMVVSDGL